MNDLAAPTTPKTPVYVTVNLDNPIVRGADTVTAVRLRKPTAGQLRGVQLQAIFQMDVVALSKVVPRISEPVLLADDVFALEAEDFTSIAGEVVGFLLTRSQKAEAGL